jgi:hypothetical protein
MRRGASSGTGLAISLAAAAAVFGACGLLPSSQPSAHPLGGHATVASGAPTPTTGPGTSAQSPTPTHPATLKPSAAPRPSSTSSPTPTPTPTPTVKKPGDTLQTGDSGAYVRTVQQRLSELGYWNGAPDGSFGQLTEQAVMALQKAAGLGRDGVFGPSTRRALDAGVRPSSQVGGDGVEIDKARQLLLVVRGGRVAMVLNTSTGSGQHYSYQGNDAVALTPSGAFSVFRTVDHLDKGPLGDLWRPRYFNGGIAVHGAAAIPGYPASHGCARVSDAAMDMIWAQGLMPVGSRVVVY